MCTDILFKVSVFVCLISALVLVFFFLGVELIYSVVVVSGVQHSDSVVCVCSFPFTFFSILVYYKILNMVPCAIQQDLAA